MSDMYLVLRSRLESVADSRRQWIDVGTDVMKEARTARGLSYETVARLTHVSSKTYERYEKRGRLPADEIDVFAEALGLSIERPEFVPGTVTIPPPATGEAELVADRLERVVAEAVERLSGEIAALADRVAESERRRSPRGSGSSRTRK